MKIHLTTPEMLTQCVILFTVFGGNPHQWASFLVQQGSAPQRNDDLPFVNWLIATDRKDETFLRDLRLLIFDPSRVSH